LWLVKVLIVDSSARVRSRLGERFADEGFKVVHANGLDDAIVILRLDAVDAIVFDLHMGIADALERLRAEAPRALLVVLTNESPEPSRTECLRRGADFVFDKSSEFDPAIEAIMSRRS
jgi:DNA-binding response OmpR family regulator